MDFSFALFYSYFTGKIAHVYKYIYSAKQISDKQPNHNTLIFVFVHIVLSIVKLGHTVLKALYYTRRPYSITISLGGGREKTLFILLVFLFL